MIMESIQAINYIHFWLFILCHSYDKKLEFPLLLNLYTEDILEIFLLQTTKLEQSLPMILQFFELKIKI